MVLPMDNGNDNFAFVGQIKNYKGIDYKMNNGGMYGCVGLPPNEALNGLYTSPQALHAAIDALEAKTELASNAKQVKR
jgi:hypothetical protein